MTDIYGTIYHITNLQNGKVYIGQTIHSYHKRCKQHVSALRLLKHRNEYLQNAFIKHGINSFITGSLYHAVCREELDAAEDQYIDYYNTLNPEMGYNLKTGGSNGIPNESVRAKMRKPKSPEGRHNIKQGRLSYYRDNPQVIPINNAKQRQFYKDNPMFAACNSQRVKQQWSSIEARHRHSMIRRNSEPYPQLLSPDNIVYTIFPSLRTFAKEHSISVGNLHNVITGRLSSTKGWKLYKENN